MKKLVDSHLHMHGGYSDIHTFFAGMDRLAELCGYDQWNFAMTPRWDKEYIGQNPLGILYKALHPGKVFSYAGFDYYLPEGVRRKDLAAQAKRSIEMGFDGIKMVELKPTVQRNLGGARISDDCYAEMFSWLEETKTPLLLHVGDPETFWDEKLCPDFALQKGWLYAGGEYSSKEALYEDTERVLRAHPGLQVSLAHFCFLSDDLPRAGQILDAYPNVRFDLTPGIEMYGNFAKRPQDWHDFFIRYQDRILFGTDNGGLSADYRMPMQEKIDYAVSNVGNIGRFLETTERFSGYGMQLQGIGLPAEVVEKICSKNFENMAGAVPKPVDIGRALDYTEELIAIFENSGVPFYELVFPQMLTVRDELRAMRG